MTNLMASKQTNNETASGIVDILRKYNTQL